MDSITPILDETLDPPTIAAKGRLGSETAPSRYSSSFSRRRPPTDGLRKAVTPVVEA
jgi:hypothetical protein